MHLAYQVDALPSVESMLPPLMDSHCRDCEKGVNTNLCVIEASALCKASTPVKISRSELAYDECTLSEDAYTYAMGAKPKHTKVCMLTCVSVSYVYITDDV